MELLESINNIEVSDNNKYFLDDICDSYKELIDKLKSLSIKMQKYYYESLKDKEYENNSKLENVDEFIISLYGNMQRKTSLKEIIKLYSEKDNLTKEELLKLHKLLMTGTDIEKEAGKFRTNDNYFVGAIDSHGNKRVDYEVLSSSLIVPTVQELLTYLNETKTDNPFITPFIFHAGLSIIQPFADGNTRLSRLVQHGKIWRLTNDIFDSKLCSPVIYLSKNYLISRGNYRELLTLLAQNPSNENWNKWITYNLNMTEEQLFYQGNNIQLIRERNL